MDFIYLVLVLIASVFAIQVTLLIFYNKSDYYDEYSFSEWFFKVFIRCKEKTNVVIIDEEDLRSENSIRLLK